jgi:hypothetical protein
MVQRDALVALGIPSEAIVTRDDSSLIFAKRVVWPAPAPLHRMCATTGQKPAALAAALRC